MEHAKKIIPEIEGLYSLIPNKPSIRFFEGKEGIVSIYEDHISTDKKYEMLAFSNTAEVIKFLSPKFLNNYVRRKEKIGIITRGITPNTDIDRRYKQIVYKGISKKFWPQLYYLGQNFFFYKVELTIYSDNKVSLLKLEENRPIGIIIEDKSFHDTMRMIFELSWEGAKIIQD